MAILCGLTALADRSVLANAPAADEGETARDRLFDVIMRRFDALQPYREGLAAIVRDGAGIGVLDALCGAQRILASMRWMLEAAGISSGGVSGALRAKGLAVLYGTTFATWLRDDTTDLAKTMAALDRNLDRAERLAGVFGVRSGRGRTRPGPGEAGSEASA